MREPVGIILRLPAVATLAVLWICSGWALIVARTSLAIVFIPIAYPFLYGFALAFQIFAGIKEEILPDYWAGYPVKYVDDLRTGFPILKEVLLNGFHSSEEAKNLLLPAVLALFCSPCLCWCSCCSGRVLFHEASTNVPLINNVKPPAKK